MKLELSRIPSPIGTVLLVTRPDTGRVCALDFDDCRERMHDLLAKRFGPHDLAPSAREPAAAAHLRAYLEGELGALDEVRVDTGGTPFQHRVWLHLREIPPGTTQSYAELARTIGRPGAARAVGTTNGRNPIALVLPCHRVISADGSLGGYAGGLARKRWLLGHEGVALEPD